MIRAALYVRVSTTEQAMHGYSIQEQTDRLKNYCSAMGWTVYKVYTDPGYSGGSMERPALQGLIKASQRHSFDKVVVYKLDRLSRSQRDTLTLLEEIFNANSVDFVSMSENFDTSTPFGRATIGILAVFAQLEREQIKERMSMGRDARAKSGGWMGSYHIPIGYDYLDGKLQINPYEAMQIREIFSAASSGSSAKTILKYMQDKGYKHKYGSWNIRTLRRVLESKTYLGYIYYKGFWYPSDHEPILSEDTFNSASKMIQERRDLYNANIRSGKATSYLAGLLICKHCGAKYHRINGKYHSYYYCASRSKRTDYLVKDPDCKNKNWRMDQLDQIIFDQIRQLALDPEYIHDPEPEEDNSEILLQEISKIEKQISRLLDLYGLDQMPMDQLQEKIHLLQDQKDNLEEQLRRPAPKMEKSEAINIANGFSEILDHGSFEQIRTVLFTLIDKILLDQEDIEIHWKFK